MGMEGRLVVHGSVLAFHSLQPSSRALILVGGLSDDLSFVLTELGQAVHQACMENSWELIIPQLRSAGLGWGQSSLDEDVLGLRDLLKSLGHERLVMMGHSTGCQDLVHLARGLNDPRVKLMILQAPVSDREMAFHLNASEATEILRLAQSLPPERLLPLPWGFCGQPVAVTAYRVQSLLARGGDDDYFSTDLSREERRLASLSQPEIQVIFGDVDECFPHKERADQYLADLQAACSAITKIHRLPGNHALSGLAKEVISLLSGLLREVS